MFDCPEQRYTSPKSTSTSVADAPDAVVAVTFFPLASSPTLIVARQRPFASATAEARSPAAWTSTASPGRAWPKSTAPSALSTMWLPNATASRTAVLRGSERPSARSSASASKESVSVGPGSAVPAACAVSAAVASSTARSM